MNVKIIRQHGTTEERAMRPLSKGYGLEFSCAYEDHNMEKPDEKDSYEKYVLSWINSIQRRYNEMHDTNVIFEYDIYSPADESLVRMYPVGYSRSNIGNALKIDRALFDENELYRGQPEIIWHKDWDGN